MTPTALPVEGIVPILSVPVLDDESLDVDGLVAEAGSLTDRECLHSASGPEASCPA
jgi:hypothetical protein